MSFPDLRAFLRFLEARHDLARITEPVSPRLEFTEIARRVLAQDGPALLFEHPTQGKLPALANLFGSVRRIAWALGLDDPKELRSLGEMLAFFRQPEPPRDRAEALRAASWARRLLAARPKRVAHAPWQAICREGKDVDLAELPIQTCWPGDVAPLLTWGLVITRHPERGRINLGVYRQQLLDRNRLIMRWLRHRGGALDHRLAKARRMRFPVAVAIGAAPSVILAAAAPVPDTLSELHFAGLLAGRRIRIVRLPNGLPAPASAEIVLEGEVSLEETAPEGPFGDHTGYYNEVEQYPVFHVQRLWRREDAIYHTTYTGRPPDEPAMIAVAFNELFVPIIRRQFPEIVDFYLPMEACSYRMAIVSIKKAYPGHAKRILFGVWGFLRQFSYTKIVVVVDEDIDVRNWGDVIWAITTRADPARDCVIVPDTPIDHLDFASPEPGLGGKLGIDATNKLVGETKRDWGRVLEMDDKTKARIDAIWSRLGLG